MTIASKDAMVSARVLKVTETIALL